MMSKIKAHITIGIDENDFESMKKMPLEYEFQKGIIVKLLRFKNDDEKYDFHNETKTLLHSNDELKNLLLKALPDKKEFIEHEFDVLLTEMRVNNYLNDKIEDVLVDVAKEIINNYEK